MNETLTSREFPVPPGPPGLPLLGNAAQIQSDPIAFLDKNRDKYGGLYSFRVLGRRVYHLNDPDGIQHVLQDNNKNYRKGFDATPTVEMVLGHGLLTNEGESWLKQRRLMQPMFHHRVVESFAEMMTSATLELVEKWKARGQTTVPLDVAADMMRLTLTVANRALFNTDISAESERVGKAIPIVLEDVTLRFSNPLYPPPQIPTPHNRRLLRALHDMDEVIYGLISERRQNPREANDLLNLLLHAQENGQGMSEKQLRDEVMTLFIAGHETTSVTLSWAFYLLSRHPEVEERLRAELAQVLNGRTPTAADLPALTLTRQVLDEALRLYPPAWLIARICLGPDEVCGYPIRPGQLIGMSPYSVHRNPKYWPDPERFDPDRFSPANSAGRHSFAYFPFGGGPRQCIGKGFALVEAPLVLATIMQHFRLTLAPGARVELQPLATLRPRYGMPMELSLLN